MIRVVKMNVAQPMEIVVGVQNFATIQSLLQQPFLQQLRLLTTRIRAFLLLIVQQKSHGAATKTSASNFLGIVGMVNVS